MSAAGRRPAPAGAEAFAGLGLSELRALAVRRLGTPGRHRPDVLLLESGSGTRAVLKDFGDRGLRALFGRWLASREARAHRALQGLDFVPRLWRRVGPAALLFEWRDASPLLDGARAKVTESFIEEFRRDVDRLHERGVAHLDLRGRRNVLVDAAGRPAIVDFGAAAVVGRRSPLRLLFPLLRAIDRGAILKHKRRLRPSSLSEAERRADRFFAALGRAWHGVRLH